MTQLAGDRQIRPLDKRYDAAMIALAIVAVAAQLMRRADATFILNGWLISAFQAPALLLWEFLSARESSALVPKRSQRWINSVVLLGALAVAVSHRTSYSFFTATTIYIACSLMLDALCRLYERLAAHMDRPQAIWPIIWRPWLGATLIASILLALPVATHSAVPDYAHNFLQHVLNSAFSAFSAACLVGTSIYGFAEDYNLFGQIIIVLLMQFAGVVFSAIGLAVARPFLRKPIRLGTVLKVGFGLQAIAVVLTWSAWLPKDAGGFFDRTWWSIVHAGSALWNSGWVFRSDGLAAYLNDIRIFSCITVLAITGSIGLPIILDLLVGGGKSDDATNKKKVSSSIAPPRLRLPTCEAVVALILLFSASILLFYFETPGTHFAAMTPPRPFELGGDQKILQENQSPPERWRTAVFVGATLGSAGMQSIPVSQGTISWPSFALMLLWMTIGGSAIGVAGGLRTSAFILLGLSVFSSQSAWRVDANGLILRRTLIRRLSIFIPTWLGLCLLSAVTLAAVSQGTIYEIVFDSIAAFNGVGLSTGLALHLTWLGRIVMILLMVGGKCIAAIFWLSLAARMMELTASTPRDNH